MTTKRITTREATISTATIQVRTITLGARQVTLSVYRQLMNEPVIDWETLKLNGVPWGRVHYFPGACAAKENSGHLHVVWQTGDELRRACVEPHTEETFEQERYRAEAFDRDSKAWRSALFCALAAEHLGEVEYEPAGSGGLGMYRIRGLHWPLDQHTYHDSPIHRVAALVGARDGRPGSPSIVTATKSLYAATEQWLKPFGVSPVPTPAEIEQRVKALAARYREAADRLAQRETAYAALYDQLAALPQLFIAT